MKQIVTVHMTGDPERITQCSKWAELVSDSEAPGILAVAESYAGVPVRVFLPPVFNHFTCAGHWSYQVVPADTEEVFGLPKGETLYLCEHGLAID